MNCADYVRSCVFVKVDLQCFSFGSLGMYPSVKGVVFLRTRVVLMIRTCSDAYLQAANICTSTTTPPRETT